MSGALAQRTRKVGHLGAAYFCRHYDNTRNDPRYLLGTVACQLCYCNVQYCNLVGGKGGVSMMLNNSKLRVHELFTKLLEEPLSNCDPCQQRKLVIIDALDETEHESREEFLELVKKRFPRLPKWLVFFITSRPEDTVQSRLERYNPCIRICAGYRKQHSLYQHHEQDIQRFLENEVDFSRLPYSVEEATKKCNGLFLYAFYIAKVLKDSVNSGKIDQLSQWSGFFPGDIEDFFYTNFKRVLEKVGEDLYRKLFGRIITAPAPLPVSFISFILNKENSVLHEQDVIDAVSLFVVLRTSNQTVTFLHNLIPAWITNKRRARKLFIDKKTAGEYLGSIFVQILFDVVEEMQMLQSVDADLQRFVLQVAVRFLCQHGDKDLLKDVFSYLTSYRFLEKRIRSGRIEIYHLLEDLKLALSCFTGKEAQEQIILQEISLALETDVHVLLECPHLLRSCIRNASNAVQNSVLVPQVSAPWMEWNICDISAVEFLSGCVCFATASDKKTVAAAKGLSLFFVNSSTLQIVSGPFEFSQDTIKKISHLEFSADDKFVFFGRLDKWFSVERECVEDLSQFVENSFSCEWCLRTSDGQSIVVRNDSFFVFPQSCKSKLCITELLALWAMKEIDQSEDDQKTCSFSRLEWKIAGFSSIGDEIAHLLEFLQMEPRLYKTQVTFVPDDSTCYYCGRLKELKDSNQESSLATVRQLIIELYPRIFLHQVWNLQTGKPLLYDIFYLGAQFNSFTYFCHVTSAFEEWAIRMGCCGVDQALSVCNIAIVNAISCLLKIQGLELEWGLERVQRRGWVLKLEGEQKPELELELERVQDQKRKLKQDLKQKLEQVLERVLVLFLWNWGEEPLRSRKVKRLLALQKRLEMVLQQRVEKLELELERVEELELVLKRVERLELVLERVERLELVLKRVERLELERKRVKELELERVEELELELETVERLELELKRVERLGLELERVERLELERKRVERLELERKRVERLELERKRVERLELELERVERLELERKRVERLELELERVEELELERKRVERLELELERVEELELERRRVERLELERKRVERLELERKRVERLELELERVEELELERKRVERLELELERVEELELERKRVERLELMLEELEVVLKTVEVLELVLEEKLGWKLEWKSDLHVDLELFCDSFKSGLFINSRKDFSDLFGTVISLCVSPKKKWVAVRNNNIQAIHLLRTRIQEEEFCNDNSAKQEHFIARVVDLSFTTDDLYVVYLSNNDSLHALSLQTGTVFTSVSGRDLFYFTREKQTGYLFRDETEERAIFLKNLYSRFKFFPGTFPRKLDFRKSITMIFSSSNTVMSVSSDLRVTLWNITSEKRGITFKFISNSSLTSLWRPDSIAMKCVPSPDGKFIAIQKETKIELYSIAQSGRIHSLVFKEDFGFTDVCLTFSADGTFLFFCVQNNFSEPHFYVWDVQKKAMLVSFESPGLRAVECFCLSSDKKNLILCGEYEIEVWEYDTLPGRLLKKSGVEKFEFSQCIVSLDNELLVCCIANVIYVYSLHVADFHSSRRVLLGHLGKIEFCKFLKVNRYLISYGVDGMVFLWDIVESKAAGFARIALGLENIVSMAVSPAEDRVVCFLSSDRVSVIDLCKLECALSSEFLTTPAKGRVNTAEKSLQQEGRIASLSNIPTSSFEDYTAEAFRSPDLEERFLLTPDDFFSSDESD